MKYDKLHSFSVTMGDDAENKKLRKFYIRKPNRRLSEDADLFHGKMINEALTKHKLIARALLAKIYTEHDGVYTDKEKFEYKDLLTKMRELETEYRSILIKDSEIRSEKENNRLHEIAEELFNIRTRIRDFEIQEDSLYEYTAESYAKKKFIFWWVVNTAYEEIDDNNHEIVLKGNSYDDKLDYYERLIDENGEFWREVFGKFTYYIAIWLSANVNGNVKTFQEVLDILDGSNVKDDVVEAQSEVITNEGETKVKKPKKSASKTISHVDAP